MDTQRPLEPREQSPEAAAPRPAIARVAPTTAPLATPAPTFVPEITATPAAVAVQPAQPAAAAKPRKSVITLDHVSKRFGEVVGVDDVTFEVYEGEIFGFIGPSGSGKTTTMRLINGIFTPSDGKVTLLDANPAKPTRHLHEGFGYLPQLFVLYRNLSVYENLNFISAVHGMGWRERRKRIREMLDFVEMWGSRKTLAGDISGGMQRRLELAAALIHNPKLLFADEPTAGIDPILRGKFWDEFRRLREAGHTLFVTTQYVGESEYCDRVGVIQQGKLIAIGTPLELRRRAMGGDIVDVSVANASQETINQLAQMPFVEKRNGKPILKWLEYPRELRVNVDDAGEAVPQILRMFEDAGVEVTEIGEYKPSFDDVFIALLGAAEQPA